MHQHVIGNLHACMHDDDNGDHVLIAYLQVKKYVLDSRGLYGYICHMVRVGFEFSFVGLYDIYDMDLVNERARLGTNGCSF